MYVLYTFNKDWVRRIIAVFSTLEKAKEAAIVLSTYRNDHHVIKVGLDEILEKIYVGAAVYQVSGQVKWIDNTKETK